MMVALAEKRSWVLPGAVVVLASLLVLLATLQYRWVGEITANERARLRAGAQARAEQLGREFDREITEAFVGLQVDGDSVEKGDFRAYAERYARWASRAPHPDLVRDVFLVEGAGRGAATIARFDPATGTFQRVPWPAELEALRERAEASPTEPGPPRSGLEGAPEVDGVPILVAPVMPPMPADRSLRPGPPLRRALLGIVLAAEAIRGEVLPALARRHFAGEKGLEYEIEVTSRSSPEAVIFASGTAGRLPRADATASLFALRFDELTDRDRAELGPGRRFAARRERFRGPGVFRGFQTRPDAGFWRLVASRRGGSVEQVVEAARRRNLAVSFGILLLLGGSAGLVLAAASRARHLASRQMEFVAGVSHELRTPVAVICSAGENLADGVVAEAAQVKRYGATIRDEGRRLAAMVQQVLDFAGTYSGRQSLRVERLDPIQLVEEVLGAEGGRAERSGFTVERRLDRGLPAIQGDASALRRALQNLLDNARKYSGSSRWIGVSVSAATLADGRPGVCFSVEDRGLGIDPKERRRIFEPFYRGRAAHEGSEHGFGLGLSLVKSIARTHRGAVDVRAGQEQGTVFSIVVPAAPPEVTEAGAERSVDGIADSAR